MNGKSTSIFAEKQFLISIERMVNYVAIMSTSVFIYKM